MILEVARIDIRPDRRSDFEAAMREALGLLAESRGFRGAELYRSHEVADRYRLLVRWNTIENHTVDWQRSGAFLSWRGLLRDFFVDIPSVEHMHPVMERGEP